MRRSRLALLGLTIAAHAVLVVGIVRATGRVAAGAAPPLMQVVLLQSDAAQRIGGPERKFRPFPLAPLARREVELPALPRFTEAPAAAVPAGAAANQGFGARHGFGAAPLLSNPPQVASYPPGSWGPAAARKLIAPDRWLLGQ